MVRHILITHSVNAWNGQFHSTQTVLANYAKHNFTKIHYELVASHDFVFVFVVGAFFSFACEFLFYYYYCDLVRCISFGPKFSRFMDLEFVHKCINFVVDESCVP